MKAFLSLPVVVFICTVIAGCNNGNSKQNEKIMPGTDSIKNELKKIDSLLQDSAFTEAMAAELDASYYKGMGETPPPFLAPDEDSSKIEKSVKEEKIATNLAGFYALECGVNYLCAGNNSTPSGWIERITANKIGEEDKEILNRFANLTWKAGQPFRGMNRIKKTNFTGWSGLSEKEVEKDFRQIRNAAAKLQPLVKGNKKEQFEQLKKLLQDKKFAYSIAATMDSSYNAGENKTVPPLISKEEASAKKKKSFKQEKIAMNAAGFYALECCINYLVSKRNVKPSSILQSIINNKISKDEKELFSRFANAAWKAGQPFRSIDRITRDVFVPYNFLSTSNTEKDWMQIKAAAAKLLAALE